jgi:hypothetical protein
MGSGGSAQDEAAQMQQSSQPRKICYRRAGSDSGDTVASNVTITTINRIISRMPTMFQIQIVDIGHIVMTSVRMVLTARGPCNTHS